MIVANDATVKAGAWFPITAQEGPARAGDRASRTACRSSTWSTPPASSCRCRTRSSPTASTSAGSSATTRGCRPPGIFQIAAIMGSCVAGGAYLPIMSDETHIVEGTGSIFLAGSHLVKAAIGEAIDNEALGGAVVQCDISGVVDHRHPDEAACLAKIRAQFAQARARRDARRSTAREPQPPRARPGGALRHPAGRPLAPVRHARAARAPARRLASSTSTRQTYGQTLVCGYRPDRRLGGRASSPTSARSSRKTGSSQGRGAADRRRHLQRLAPTRARASSSCATRSGSRWSSCRTSPASWSARAPSAAASSRTAPRWSTPWPTRVVPKITVFVGNSYGAGNYAMCGKAYDAALHLRLALGARSP